MSVLQELPFKKKPQKHHHFKTAIFVFIAYILIGCEQDSQADSPQDSPVTKVPLTLAEIVHLSALACQIKDIGDPDYKLIEIMHKPAKQASLISNGVEMFAKFDVIETEKLKGVDYNVYKMKYVKDHTREVETETNMGFYVTSYSEQELKVQTTRGNARGICKVVQ